MAETSLHMARDCPWAKHIWSHFDVVLPSRFYATHSTRDWVDVPKPKAYNGARDAKELDNFLFNCKRYFDDMGIRDEAKKVSTASLCLSDLATLWWRRNYMDMERGTVHIDTWADFKREIKAQFYPQNVELEARRFEGQLEQKWGSD
ncbi:hypothetical protein Tsubulata_005841 [Turnera subulata]|uniref:Retrotransposon gag domain-containing protein n=1 Tax=Turnera subulata TaxID=218843 RepID=A0A9Q0GHG2_9ROSI|nr:hypothetical protein Tsubulata_005841 [Turnera subulata]